MKRAKSLSLKTVRILCAFLLALTAVLVFFLSDDSRILALTCSGNYYYSSQEVYSIAGISSSSRLLIHPSFLIEQKLEQDPLIESADVKTQGQTVHIQVQEKLIIGYYVQDDLNYMLTSTGESIPIESSVNMKNLIHFPLLADLSEEQMQSICEQFQKYPDYLNRAVLEKIAEILPWSESYDENMLKMVMQDGNVVFTSMDSLYMMTNYQLMLTELQGENVCLILDGENDAIDKLACSYMYMSSEERDAYRQELAKALEEAAKAAEEAAKKKETEEAEDSDAESTEDDADSDSSENPDEGQEEAQDPDGQEDEDLSDQESQEEESEIVDADDWEQSDYDWLYYSPSTDTYMSISSGTQYKWVEETASFRELQ